MYILPQCSFTRHLDKTGNDDALTCPSSSWFILFFGGAYSEENSQMIKFHSNKLTHNESGPLGVSPPPLPPAGNSDLYTADYLCISQGMCANHIHLHIFSLFTSHALDRIFTRICWPLVVKLKSIPDKCWCLKKMRGDVTEPALSLSLSLFFALFSLKAEFCALPHIITLPRYQDVLSPSLMLLLYK